MVYRYDHFDRDFVVQRAKEFRIQVERRLKGELNDDEFRPLRLMNGLYLQLHAYMLRVAIPYGVLSSVQLRGLGDIARRYDRDYGHFTTRQNIQYNWIKLEDVPDILDDLAKIEMHAIQTSGNCIRNVTSDPWAGVAADEVIDPRPTAEFLRQWSSLHPEFSFLPRKFKIAVTGAHEDRAAILVHDIGIRIKRNAENQIGYEILAGGGQGRTPAIAVTICDFVSQETLLPWLEAMMRVYNMYGRRDNKYKARIKILVASMGQQAFREAVEAEYQKGTRKFSKEQELAELRRIESFFPSPDYESESVGKKLSDKRLLNDDFDRWVRFNVGTHKISGYAIANISLKPKGGIPGDMSTEQMHRLADLAEEYSRAEIRVTHRQNLVFPHIRQVDLFNLWQDLLEQGLADGNIGLASDIISCPGLDYCGLATARSIPIAQQLSQRFSAMKKERDVGDITINISGCINACGHHHVGNIGILGLDKRGEEFYQISLGGDAGAQADIGKIVGPGFSSEEVSDAVECILDTYLAQRAQGEKFIDTYGRIGQEPFREALYGNH